MGSGHILRRFAQECVMTNVCIERKTASLAKTVKTVETDASPRLQAGGRGR
jgi:hypothetical protein